MRSTRWPLLVLGCCLLAGCGSSEPDTVAAQNLPADDSAGADD